MVSPKTQVHFRSKIHDRYGPQILPIHILPVKFLVVVVVVVVVGVYYKEMEIENIQMNTTQLQ